MVLTPEQAAVLAAANAYYRVKDFEQLAVCKASTAFKGVPNLDDVRAWAMSIVLPMEEVGMVATSTQGPLFLWQRPNPALQSDGRATVGAVGALLFHAAAGERKR